jgi:hypothetical protein
VIEQEPAGLRTMSLWPLVRDIQRAACCCSNVASGGGGVLLGARVSGELALSAPKCTLRVADVCKVSVCRLAGTVRIRASTRFHRSQGLASKAASTMLLVQ